MEEKREIRGDNAGVGGESGGGKVRNRIFK
jgi:hypothetical protein